MKKALLIALTLIIAQQSSAQFNKGRILAGGTVRFDSDKSKDKTGSTTVDDYKATSVTLAPNVGYFIIDKLAVGGRLSLSSTTLKDAGNSGVKSSSSGFTISPFVRYYLDPGIFFQGQVGFGTSKNKITSPPVTTETTYATSVWEVGAGYAYFLNDNVAVEPFVGYSSRTNKDGNNKDIYNSLFLNVGLQVYLGARN